MTETDVLSRAAAERMDAADPLRTRRRDFFRDKDDLIYLDGNSLGRLPAATPEFLGEVMRDGWGRGLVRSWETWIDWSRRLGDRLAAHVLGAAPGEVVLSDSTSVNLYKLAAAAVDAAPGRATILSDAEDFPTNRYILQGLADQRGLKLRRLRSDPREGLGLDALNAELSPDVALVVLSLVSYRSGALLDMTAVNEAAARAGAIVLWDLSHAAGVVPIRLGASGAGLAVGTTYKYLNAGPGAPGFLYVRRELQQRLRQPVWGWFSQRDQFAMGEEYEPAGDLDRFLVGTPPLLSLAAVEPALDVAERAPVAEVRGKSVRLTELAIALFDQWLAPRGFGLASPRDPARRGSHVSVSHPQAALLSRALRARMNVICDFRAPDLLRAGMSPLYTRFTDVWDGLDRLRSLADSRDYERIPATPTRVT